MDNTKIFSQAIKESPNLVYVSDITTYDLYFLNKIGRKLFGFTDDEDVTHKKCYEVIENRTSPCPYCIKKPLSLENVHAGTVLVPLYDKYSELIGIIGINDPQKFYKSEGLLGSICKFIADYLEKTQLIGKLSRLSYTDALSNLKNRYSYAARLELFEESPLDSLGVIYLDINGLKELNDAYGHTRGDAMIAQLGQILQEIFGNDAFRVGGDEFIVLRDNIKQDDFESQVRDLIQSVNKVQGLSVSIGHIWNDITINVSKQIEKADSLMYSEKISHYQNNSKNVRYRTVLRNSLAADIKAGKFVVFLQPQFSLKDNSLSGAEALLRKITPARSIDYPDCFIPLYERLEIVHYLDLFVFKTVCMTLERWNKLGYDYVSISVNMSRVTLQQPGIVERIVSLCADHGVEHHQIVVEVTETIQSQSSEYLSKVLLSIAAQGFLLSLDDFGSGYSSLLTLAQSEFSEIKIDKEFILGLDTSQRSLALVRYTIDMCNELNIVETVAKGIETKEICDMLKYINCIKGQGYFFDKPMPIADFSNKYLS